MNWDKVHEAIESGAFDEFFKEQEKEKALLRKRIDKVAKYLEDKDFDSILKRLMEEHDDKYRDKCLERGYEPYPTNKMTLLFEYVTENYSPIKDAGLENMFTAGIWFVKGYYFHVMLGQGTVWKIYNDKKEEIFNI